MKNEKFTARDGKVLNCYLWDEVENPRGIVQIAHGMVEHASRYDRFARFLNEKGLVVFADDHRGHGLTAGSPEDVTKVGSDKNIFFSTMNDELEITDMLVKRYNLPLIMFGHSYGSFITQAYIQNGSPYKGVLICGSARHPFLLPIFGGFMAFFANLFRGKDGKAKLIDKIALGKDREAKAYGLSRDKEECRKYYEDEYCGAVATAGFYKAFFKGIKAIRKKKNINKIDKSKPIMIMSGAADPVGGKSKYVNALYEKYVYAGINDITKKLYPDARHEILNEINRDEVFVDVLAFIDKVLAKK